MNSGQRRPLDGPSEDSAAVWNRPLERLLQSSDSHLALVLRRRNDGRGAARIAGVAGSQSDIRPLDHAAMQLLGGAGRSRDAVDEDGRTAVFWLQGLPCSLALVVVRRLDAPPFAPRDLESLREGVRWIEDIAALWWQNRRAAARAEGLRAGFGLRGTAAILLDGRGTIIEVNDAAHALFKRQAGLVRNGDRIVATDPKDTACLMRAVTAALVAGKAGRQAAPHCFALTGGDAAGRLHVAVMQPYHAPAMRCDVADPAVLVLAVDPWAVPDLPASLSIFYRLSPTQARLAARLVGGDTLAESADALGVTQETARTYLKQVFDKTGTRRQSGLIRLMLMGQVPTRRSSSYTLDPPRPGTRIPIAVAGQTSDATTAEARPEPRLNRTNTVSRVLRRVPRGQRGAAPRPTPP